MKFVRTIRHLFSTRLATRGRFTADVERAISAAVRDAEARSSAQIRFAIETALDLPELMAGLSARERAHQVFAQLRVWDTEHRNGVLIYLLEADRHVEIVADRGAAARIANGDWEQATRLMEDHFRSGRYRDGALAGVDAVGRLLARHFPVDGENRDELPNQPALL